ncbi:hypothetical protein SCHPADRAFT_933110 [Schizopora paradoxa]|uniref:Uncharacterized protein n=1 Tax=Schizopora paradoxa TaxID=27342 RepID=A0A0H2RNE4_9AGAM|nr:hypothetical protein SCHPADRAFT_933110 [Schizopora paradoxa]
MHRRSDSISWFPRNSIQRSPSPTSALQTASVPNSPTRAFHKRFSDSVVLSLAKTTPILLFSPKQVSNQIRRICLHDQTALFQRHADFQRDSCDSTSRISEKDMRSLRSLCSKLLNFTSRGEGGFYMKAAKNEALALAVRDPLIYTTFQALLRDKRDDSALFNIETGIVESFSDSEQSRYVYWIWSIFFTSLDRMDHDITETCSDELKKTLSGLDLIASYYLACALTLEIKGWGRMLLLDLWEHFVEVLARIDINEQCHLTTSFPGVPFERKVLAADEENEEEI